MINVSEVTKVYRIGENPVEALRGVSFRIPHGACAFIMGPSGSGKSTLLTLLGTLVVVSVRRVRLTTRTPT